MRTKLLETFALAVAFGIVGCDGVQAVNQANVGGTASVGGTGPGSGGGSTVGVGGTTAVSTGASTGGFVATGGSNTGNNASGGAATGGKAATGGAGLGGAATGGKPATGGAGLGGAATGGNGNGATGGAAMGGAATGGTAATGGAGLGGAATGGMPGMGGASTGGTPGAGGARTGGAPGTGGAKTGGAPGTGGATGVAGGTSTVNCSATMPTGGTQHSGNSQGGAGNLAWQIWSNQGSGTLTTFSTPAFSASWNNSGDYLGRMGFEWGNSGKTYDKFGTITAQFAYTKTGTGGGFSYIGIYGWSTNPCVEYYIVDDSFNTFPFNAYNATQKGTVTIDGEVYKLFQNSTSGTGGSRCSGVSNWNQFWSIRQKARQCGTISVTQHFDAWKAAGMTLGSMLEAKILVEVGGGSGSVNFPVANMTAQ